MNQFSLFDSASGDQNYNNQFLFSDHYLDEILRREGVWAEAQTAAAKLLPQLRQLYESQQKQLAHYNESQLEDNWFRPILALLGHTVEGQATIPGLGGGIKKPDYVFFPDEAARLTAVSAQNSAEYTQNALAVGEVKAWEVNLSRKTGKAPTFADNNPMYQIDTYLRATGLEWAILSNGRFWRLIHKESAYRLDCYFEIDLLAALDSPFEGVALPILTYFTLFFRQAAFLPDPQEPDPAGQPFLNRALDASRAYARALEADLRDNAYRALEQLILGFFAANPRQLDRQQAEDREKVYRNSLFLLYRLLFLLYGESRGLLPMDNPIYAERFSLKTLAAEINQRRNRLDKELASSRSYWLKLWNLFHIIAGVDPHVNAELGVPRYNGGLFLPERHPFLEAHPVGDRHLMQAIDYLAYRRAREDGRFTGYEAVDYRTLSERQLGSIYEGLLEYRVSLAETEMVTVRKGGVERWLPAAERGRATALDRRRPGELYMATDKGERKATGSYYTPDYIVKYIVEQTLGPLVEGIREEVKAEIDGRSFANEEAKAAAGSARFVERILALNILDPAMGSGHFLVEATHFLARALATDPFVSLTDDGSETEDRGPRTESRGDGSSVLRPPSSVSFSEADLTHWRRRVVEACIYGVDKNEMAVELAKLSLWLVTAAADKPLSFLDHHLRHGDSLVGAWLADLERPPLSSSSLPAAEGQEPLFDESAFTGDAGLAVKGLMTIERLPSEDIEDVYAKERTYREIRQTHLARWRELANLWVSAYFGNTMSREECRDLALRLQGRGEESMLRESQAQPYLSHPALGRPDYFHWELEFPEVFFDEYGRARGEAAGFDAVIGNPPYVRQEGFGDYKSFLAERYETYQGMADLYTYFVELSLSTLRQNGSCGLIISHKFMRADYGKPLREFLTVQAKILEIVHFGDLPVFADASAYPAILILHKAVPRNNQEVRVSIIKNLNFSDLTTGVKETARNVTQSGLAMNGWSLAAATVTDLQSKIRQNSVSLEDYLDESISYGIKTGLNDAFFVDETTREKLIEEDPKSAEIIKPLVVGDDVRRYWIDYKNRYLIFTRRGVEINQYPAIRRYLEKYRSRLEPKPLDHIGTWRGRKAGNYAWYEIQDPVDYWRSFEKEKIIYPVIAKELRFTFDNEGFFPNDKCFIIATSDKYLLALLNSSLTAFFARSLLSGLRGDYLEFRGTHLKHFPIKQVDFSTPEDERTAVVRTAQAHYAAGEETAVLAWCASELENGRNDTIHDLLAYLAQQMIDLNRVQQERVARFWLDLEGVLADPDTFAKLRHKGKWAQSLHKNISAARPYVDSDSRSTITLDASLGWTEEAFTGFVRELAGSVRRSSSLVDVYRDHAGEYGRLAHQITTTDQLIDQIVYRLYGLTPDEIAIVEGT